MNVAPSSDPKRRVIAILKRNGATSTQQVARTLEVSDVAARQHLALLELKGLVQKDTAPPHGKGRPAVLWSLTSEADNLFPDGHDSLSVDLIDGIRKALGEDALQRVIAVRTRRQLGALLETVGAEATLRERLQALAGQRSKDGYMAEVVETGDGALHLIEHHCPICDAAKACRDFCTTELELFQAALGSDASIEREQHLLSGDERCVYRITPDQPSA